MSNEKSLSYQAINTYSTLNKFTTKTRNVWVVFHGMGYLSNYFLKYFKQLDLEENYIIAPQAPSKFYLNNEFKHVGASWLTKVNTKAETENILRYLEEIYRTEQLQKAPNLFLLGYSQGVSIVARWVARNKIECSQLILHSGKIPVELGPGDFKFLKNTKVSLIYGTKDPYLNPEVLEREKKRARGLFGAKLEMLPFEGGHEVSIEIIRKFLEPQKE